MNKATTASKRIWAGVGIAAIAGLTTIWTLQAQGPPAPPPGPFTAAQAAAGKGLYDRQCASCHGEHVDDGEFGPPLKGLPFRQQWGAKSADGVVNYMNTRMPPSGPGSVGLEGYVNILAYMLQEDGLKPGDKTLPNDLALLKTINLPNPPGIGGGPSGGLSPGVGLPPAPARVNPLDKFTPVTDAMLANPPAGEWLTWRRDHNNQGFSPLKQITKANVSNMRVAWTWSLPNGPNENTPLMHDGVLFVHSFGDRLQALDASTGDLLWQYSRVLGKEDQPSVKRAIALYGNRVYFGTSDAHVVALDAKTGKVQWDHTLVETKDGFRLTGGPIVAKNKVMIGTVGRVPGKNYIIALDADSGKEAWRFNTIAQPGEPGGNSWNGIPVEKRNGASVWVPASYDIQTGLVYFGVAQTYDTGPLRFPSKIEGTNSDALYTDSTLAFDPDTGKLAWYFQHQPNDQWDLDWVFERVVGTIGGKKVVMTAGKQAIYDAVDAKTGQYAFSFDMGLQNSITAIDPKTGFKTIDMKTVPGDGETKMVCPHAGGAKSWLAGSFNQTSKVMYVTVVESCMDMIPVAPGGRGSLSTGVRWALRPRPDSDGKYGRVEAINMETRKTLWKTRQRAPETTGVLATAGGVVFAGALDRSFSAYDETTGKELWRTRLNDVPSSNPISYSLNGKQYVALVVGNGGAQAATFPALVPEIQNPPDRGAALWVFEVPGK